jgi:putative FmdB family regulatory protein
MPAYDFNCSRCGETFERRLSMAAYAEGEGRECPSCGSTEVERAWTVVNVIARGSGSASSTPGCGTSGFT